MSGVAEQFAIQVRWSRGTLDRLPGCPACGSVQVKRRIDRKDDSGLMPDTWHIYECGACRSVYVNPRLDAASMSVAYADYLTHVGSETERVFTSQGIAWSAIRDYLHARFGLRTELRVLPGAHLLFRMIEPWRLKLDRFGRHLTRARFPRAGQLLDIGCGAGDFIELAGAMGWTASGCDPDPHVVAMCRCRGLNVREGGAAAFKDQAGTFNVVTLNQVIEHVIDPKALLRECFALLRPGGMVWIGLPNPRSIGFRQFGSAWAGLHPPYHLCLPTQTILSEWLVDAGFERARFQRRGAHARADWQKSMEIARQLGRYAPLRPLAWLGRVSSDFASTFSPKWGEETVAIAWKPSQ